MLGKIKLAVAGILLAVVALGGSAVAFAQGETPPPATAARTAGTRWGGGEIAALDAISFTLHPPRGADKVVAINDQTHYFDADGQAITFADLQVGDRVGGAAKTAEDGSLTALIVIDFGVRTEYRGVGVVRSVDAGEQSFVFVNRHGRVWEFYTDEATVYTQRGGGTPSFDSIQVGTGLFVHAEKRADGKWWALDTKFGRAAATVTTPTVTAP
ncbi:MAG: DUF5666 domain-containing protein [Anaerolineales bacterium]